MREIYKGVIGDTRPFEAFPDTWCSVKQPHSFQMECKAEIDGLCDLYE